MMSVMLPANSALEFLQFFPLFVGEIALLHLSKGSLELHFGNPFFPSLDTCFHTAGYMGSMCRCCHVHLKMLILHMKVHKGFLRL